MDAPGLNVYVASRSEADLAAVTPLADVLDRLADAGAAIDALLVRIERAKATMSRGERGMFEETWQTVAAMSREAWAAHTSVRVVMETRQQLEDVEARLKDAMALP